MTEISQKTRLGIPDRLAFRNIGGKVVIVKPDENKLVSLNDTASFLWDTLDHAKSLDVAALARRLEAEFDISYESALADTRHFVETLLSKALLTRMEETT